MVAGVLVRMKQCAHRREVFIVRKRKVRQRLTELAVVKYSRYETCAASMNSSLLFYSRCPMVTRITAIGGKVPNIAVVTSCLGHCDLWFLPTSTSHRHSYPPPKPHSQPGRDTWSRSRVAVPNRCGPSHRDFTPLVSSRIR